MYNISVYVTTFDILMRGSTLSTSVLENAPAYITVGDGNIGVNFKRMPVGTTINIRLVGDVHATITHVPKGFRLDRGRLQTLKLSDIPAIQLGGHLIVKGEDCGRITAIKYLK